MYGKKILLCALSLAVVGGTSAVALANQSSDASTKNVVTTVQNNQTVNNQQKDAKNTPITNEQAVKMATEAMKTYMGLDASYFSGTNIYRSEDEEKERIASEEKYAKEHPEEAAKFAADEKKNLEGNSDLAKQLRAAKELQKHRDYTIDVWFTPANYDKNKTCSNFVEIDENTGKIINITAINGLNSIDDGKIDDVKSKKAAVDFLNKMGMTFDEDSIKINNNNGSLSGISCKLKNGKTIELEVNLENYTLVHYQDYSDMYNR